MFIRIVFAICHMCLHCVRHRSDDDRGTRNIAVNLYIYIYIYIVESTIGLFRASATLVPK